MTLTTHAVVGAAVGAVAANNLPLAAAAAFMSHFLLDSIPHWDYFLASVKQDYENPLNNDMKVGGKTFWMDILKIFIDCLLALTLVLLLFWSFAFSDPKIFVAAIIGAFFGVLPDSMQFVYWKFRHEPIISLQKFHIFIATERRLNKRPFLGIGSQIIIILIAVFVVKRFLG